MENPKNPKFLHLPSSSSSPLMQTRHMPMEIITDILKYLPPKPLLRFKAVSKPWGTLISSPDFTHLHFNQSRKSDLLILSSSPESKNYLSIFDLGVCDYLNSITPDPEINPELSIMVMCSCNGILLLRNWALVNPLTRSFHKIPPCLELSSNSNNDGRQDYVYGFGYDSISHDYKIVLPAFRRDCSIIYSLKSNSWRRGPHGSGIALCYNKQKYGMYVNNALHWIGRVKKYAITFDLCHETFGLVPLPEVHVRGRERTMLELIGFGLALVSSDLLGLHVGRNDGLDVWVMKEYGVRESWTRLFRFDFDSNSLIFHSKVLGYLNGGREVIMETDLGYFRCEDEGERTKIVNLADHYVSPCLQAHLCFGSLISPSAFGQNPGTGAASSTTEEGIEEPSASLELID